MVTGLANKLLLTTEILDFCGALPIYQTEIRDPGTTSGDGTAGKQTKRPVVEYTVGIKAELMSPL